MTRKSKLVLSTVGPDHFEIVKSVNTLQHGIPGDILTRKDVNIIMKDSHANLRRGDLVVEFIKGSV